MEARAPGEVPTNSVLRRFYTALGVNAGVLVGATLASDLELPCAATVIGRQLDLKLEANTAVWFSSVILLCAGILARIIAWTERAIVSNRRVWTVVALFFMALSVDEVAQIHERIGRRFTAWFGTVPYLTDGSLPVFAWPVALLPLILTFVVAVIVALRTLAPLPRRTKVLVTAGLACWIGVVCAEIMQAQLLRWNMGRSLQGVIEEGLELCGAVLFLIGFVEVLRHRSTSFKAV